MSRNTSTKLNVQRLEDRMTPVVFANPTDALYAGTLSHTGVVKLTAPLGLLGSGTLLTSGRHILTAAQVVTGSDTKIDGPVTVTFEAAGWTPVPIVVPAGNIAVHPRWDTEEGGNDVAVLTLPEVAPAWATRHALYRGTNEVGQNAEVVGYGVTGNGTAGRWGDYTAGTKRAGWNFVEFDDIRPSTLGVDLTNNARLPLEAIPDGGDFGGPLLIGGRVAGVYSFTDFVPHEIDNNLAPTFGDSAVYARVSAVAGWIDSVTAAGQDVTLNVADFQVGNDGVRDDWGVFRNGDFIDVWRGDELFWRGPRSSIRDRLTITGTRDPESFEVASDTELAVTVNAGGGSVNELATFSYSYDSRTIRNDVEVYDDRVKYTWGIRPFGTPYRNIFHTGMSSIRVTTGDGTDYVYVDSPSTPRLDIDTRSGGGGLVNIHRLGIRGVTVHAGSGSDEIGVGISDGAAVSGDVTVNASGGGAIVRVGPLDRVARIDIHGTVARLEADDGSDTSYGNTYEVRSGGISRNATPRVEYDAVGELVLKTGARADTIAVASIPGKTTIDAGGGRDAVTVGSSTGTLASFRDLTVYAGPGGGDLILNDRGRAYPVGTEGVYSVADAKVTSYTAVPGPKLDYLHSAVGHSGFDTLRLNAGHGNDVIRVSTTQTGPAVGVYAGRGNDIVVGGAGNDNLYGEDGLDVLIGGAGVNGLYGGANDDILIGGRTTIDGDGAKLREVRRIWLTPGTTSAQRRVLLAPLLSDASMLGGTSYGEPGAGDNLLWGIELFRLPPGTI